MPVGEYFFDSDVMVICVLLFVWPNKAKYPVI